MSDTARPKSKALPRAAEFWNFSVELYGRPGVAAACLTLQDRFEADVNIVLFCCWLAKTGRGRVSARLLATLRKSVSPWHSEIVRALRALRRRLKAPDAEWPPQETESLRERIKDAEIEAERIEQVMIAGLNLPVPRARGTPRRDAKASLDRYFAALGSSLDDADRTTISILIDSCFLEVGRDSPVGKSPRRA